MSAVLKETKHRGCTIDFEQNEFYPQWVAQQLKINRSYFGRCTTIAVWRSGRICAVIVYSSFNGVNCEVTVAATSAHWAIRDIMHILKKYPFEQLNCRRLTLLIDSTNKRVARLVEKIGFLHEGTLRKYMEDGHDCLVYGLLKEDWNNV